MRLALLGVNHTLIDPSLAHCREGVANRFEQTQKFGHSLRTHTLAEVTALYLCDNLGIPDLMNG